jgi:hypothetical protein
LSAPAKQPKIMTLEFDGGRKASAVVAAPDADPRELVRLLGLESICKVILLTGSAVSFEDDQRERAVEIFDQGLAEVVDAQTAIVDGATRKGIVELIGQSKIVQERRPVLLGVAPLGKVSLPGRQADGDGKHPLDPNHTHFVLVESDQWQGATRILFDLAEALATPPRPHPVQNCELEPPKPKPRLTMLLVGGSPDQVAIEEALTCARRGWSLMVVEGSGRLADQISSFWQKDHRIEGQKQHWWSWPFHLFGQRQLEKMDPRLREVVRTGKIQVIHKESRPQELKSTLKKHMAAAEREQENILHQAWKRYTLYSYNAKRNQRLFRNFRNLALILAWVTTLVVLLQPLLQTWAAGFVASQPAGAAAQWLVGVLTPFVQTGGQVTETLLSRGLHFAIVLLPILTSLLLTAETRLKAGNKWVALRASAEAILGGIYSYRVMACCPGTNPDKIKRPKSAAELSQHLRSVTTGLVQTEITDTALAPSPEPLPPNRFRKMGDDGFSAMSGETYVRYRLLDQLTYFQHTTNRLEQTLKRYRWGIWLFGGLGTLLAAISQEYWLPLTAGTVTALSAYLEYQQVEQTLMAGNQSEAALSNVMSWWVSLPGPQRETPENLARLLDETETILETNTAVWLKHMKAAQEKAAAADHQKVKRTTT